MIGIAIAVPISGFAGCVIAAAVNDARTLRIPNILSIAILGLFAIYAGLALTPTAVLGALALGIAALMAGYIAFARGLMGGGDAKLLAVCMAWAGPVHALELIFVTGIAGGVLGLALTLPATARAAAPIKRGWPAAAASPDGVLRAPMPYGVAIAAGALTVAVRLLTS